ncbi:hypothetical protein K7432_009733 [Basidiobolus ranarum]|uniref:TM7S3/TM198-like domain-containing protein n=1 Tax=Basidiobolus ranarum TaxID=34480 RepID=A0ABR2WPW7_9FUNG
MSLVRFTPLLWALLVVAQDTSNPNLTSLEPSPQPDENKENLRFLLDPQTGLITFILCTRFSSQVNETSQTFPQSTLFLIIGLVTGIAGGFLFMCLWQVGAAMVGGMLGFCVAMTILSLTSEGLIHNEVGRWILIASFSIIGMILVAFYESDIVIIGTAFAGAYHIAMGADVFIQTGFTRTIKSFLGGSTHLAYKATPPVYGVLISMILVFGLGLYVQYSSQRRLVYVKG